MPPGERLHLIHLLINAARGKEKPRWRKSADLLSRPVTGSRTLFFFLSLYLSENRKGNVCERDTVEEGKMEIDLV